MLNKSVIRFDICLLDEQVKELYEHMTLKLNLHTFSKHFLVFSIKPRIFFLLLKKLKNFSFSGIRLEVKGVFEKNITNKYILKLVNPDNVILQKLYLTQKKFIKDKKRREILKFTSGELNLSKKYIQLFDSYGEIYLKNTFYS